jgi:hypothetical protein
MNPRAVLSENGDGPPEVGVASPSGKPDFGKLSGTAAHPSSFLKNNLGCPSILLGCPSILLGCPAILFGWSSILLGHGSIRFYFLDF